MSYGIDYADEDGNSVNAPEAVKAGAAFVGMRGAYGYGASAVGDPTPARDAIAWRAAGARVFAYLCLNYTALPELQADALAAHYTRQGNDLPVAIDLEVNASFGSATPVQRVSWAERATARLQQHYGQRGVMVYTSLQQWIDNFGGLDSPLLGSLPLWLKVPYPWNPRNPPHLADTGKLGELPTPWRRASSPGAWLQQFQGDCLGWPGLSSTCDISTFLAYSAVAPDARSAWLQTVIDPQRSGVSLRSWQQAHGLTPDGVAGPATFSQLCR